MSDDDLAWAGVAGQAAAVARGEVSSRDLVAATLVRIHRYDGRLNAFTVVLDEQALAEAAVRDGQRGDRGPLHGVPVAIKEEIDVAGQVTTFGGRANSRPATQDAEVVRRLREAGAVVVGKTNMPEFGQFPFTESVAHGLTRNPWNTSRTPGGSSGGSAAAVAGGLVPFAMGGDGGGSIRIPAACCGLFGLKPQRGRVTSAPMPHLWWGLGTAGPLTRSVLDSAIVYDVLRGSLPVDRFRAEEPTTSFAAAAGAEPQPMRVAWSTRAPSVGQRPHPSHVQAVRDTAALLTSLGHDVTEVDPGYPDATAAFLPQMWGGIRSEFDLVEDPRRLERRTRHSARLGAWARPAVVERALRQGERVAERANRVFDDHDVLLTPALACRPPEVGVLDGAGAVRALLASMPMVAYTALWNVTGNPAASVPAGFADDGLPLAVQLVGRRHDETTLLTLAAQLERARPWADTRPAL
ncbi:MAG: amidase [Nocardioidaceae bacterium]|nr:amidase [Nocardioidaceae bacterium]